MIGVPSLKCRLSIRQTVWRRSRHQRHTEKTIKATRKKKQERGKKKNCVSKWARQPHQLYITRACRFRVEKSRWQQLGLKYQPFFLQCMKRCNWHERNPILIVRLVLEFHDRRGQLWKTDSEAVGYDANQPHNISRRELSLFQEIWGLVFGQRGELPTNIGTSKKMLQCSNKCQPSSSVCESIDKHAKAEWCATALC